MIAPRGDRTVAEELAHFVASASWDDFSVEARYALELRVLDSIACAIGALG